MAILKIVTRGENANGALSLLERLNYVMRPNATNPNLMEGYYVSVISPYAEMIFSKTVFASQVGISALYGNFFIEAVISLPSEESHQLGDFIHFVREANKYWSNFQGGMYQVLSCVHVNTSHLHVHFIINNTEMKTGRRLTLSKADLYNAKMEISEILGCFGFSKIRQYIPMER